MSTEGNYSEGDLEAYLQSNKELIINSLWKLNVPDIEGTLSHVCQMVLQDNSANKEDLRARAKGLKTLGKIFQTAKLQNEDGIPERDTFPRLDKEESSNWMQALPIHHQRLLPARLHFPLRTLEMDSGSVDQWMLFCGFVHLRRKFQ
jgi:hypothetical protein